ncbi:MAG TPA: hypothetical protein VHY79_00845 [Rhizomicrobium sp.]|jgi:hypothetical protein|nr:hypothetical protein [Rhizomicrobium sp.]
MSRYNFTLSPAYVSRGVTCIPDEVGPEPVPAWTLLSAVMLATTIISFIWFG